MPSRNSAPARLTLSRIAELSGTTKSTVSRVLSGHPRISKATSERVMRVVRKYNYQPNVAARMLVHGRTDTLAVISANIGGGSFFGDVLRGIDLVLSDRRKRMLCSFAHSVEAFVEEIREMGVGGVADGLILVAPYVELFDQDINAPVPIVLCAAKPGKGKGIWNAQDSVTLDNEGAMSLLVDHLASRNPSRIVHLAGWHDNYDAVQRERAFLKCMKRHARIEAIVMPCGLIREDGMEAARKMSLGLSDARTSFLAFNDSAALGFWEGWKKRFTSRTFPLFLSGWDNLPEGVAVGLTSVEIPTYPLGIAAAELLVNRVGEAKSGPALHREVGMKLNIRTSSTVGLQL